MNTRSFYHGTRADLKVGDLLCAGYPSNFPEEPLSWIYFTETLDAAMWGSTARGCRAKCPPRTM
ncbi:NAD(+)--rifampin ADP-ribosyltransferase [Rhizobium leguminosarum]|uniref:NAD(+)--rifampin ADP-ribosyltransferase n=1 Tax=Rhizobium leguminosarum TaxID=384 RepID=UPI0028F3F8F1|nr:NAD(+)--rifampin ADP-ribosyltransferase [Rhizobium leguminosarum]